MGHVVYRTLAQPVIDGLFEGLNGTILAYGQTGSGKTHSTIGYLPTYPGILLLAAEDIFARIKKYKTTDPGGKIIMRVSYLQIYCEALQDLLVPEKEWIDLKIRMHPEQARRTRAAASSEQCE